MIMVSNCRHYKNDGAMEGLRQTNSPPDIACWVKGGWGEMEKYTGSDNSSFQLQQVWIGMRILWQLCLLEVLVHNSPWFPVRWQWRMTMAFLIRLWPFGRVLRSAAEAELRFKKRLISAPIVALGNGLLHLHCTVRQNWYLIKWKLHEVKVSKFSWVKPYWGTGLCYIFLGNIVV